VFSKNRDRLLTSDVAQQFFAAVNKQAKRFMSDEHFTVDGTLIQAWASQKSFLSNDGSDDGAEDEQPVHFLQASYLRSTQPVPAAATHGSTTSKAHGAVFLNHECGPRDRFREACHTL
jgi:hypothetical protein